MDNKILVTYASKHGSTGEIAVKIGQTLSEVGLEVDVLPVRSVGDLTQYKAVVLGSAVYIGKWRREAAAFLKANEQELKKHPVWLFSSGPTGKGDPVELLEGWRLPKALQPIADSIKPRDIAVFNAVLDTKKLSFFEKWITNKVKAPVGDFRDWDAITSWAKTIADDLKQI